MLPSGGILSARRFAPVHLAPLGSIYDILRAVVEKAAVPIYYESRISKLSMNAAELRKLDAEFDEKGRRINDEVQAADHRHVAGRRAHPAIRHRTGAQRGQRRAQDRDRGQWPGIRRGMAPTEKHVLEFFVEGLVYKEIADELGVSISTVATYVRRTYEKLHVRSRREVIARYRCPALVVHRGGQDG